MKRILACLAIALCSGEAVAQLQVVEVPDYERCREFRVSNPTNRHFIITIDYQYTGGTGLQGEKRDWVWQTNATIPPYATVVVSKQAVPLIDCTKSYRFDFQYRVDDITAKREEIDRSREQVIRNYLEAEEARKRQAEEYARKQQAEADARQRQATEQQAARDAASQRMAQSRQSQFDYEMDSVRQIVASGDPRCRQLVSPGTTPQEILKSHQECTRNVQRHDSILPRYEIGRIDPATCNTPTISLINAATPEMQAEAQRKVDQMVAECLRTRGGAVAAPAFTGPDPAVLEAQRLRAEQAEMQRQLAFEREETARQLAAQQAALDAERQAFMLQQAQQSVTQAANDLRASNADFARQSQTIQDSNAELEAWLNDN